MPPTGHPIMTQRFVPYVRAVLYFLFQPKGTFTTLSICVVPLTPQATFSPFLHHPSF